MNITIVLALAVQDPAPVPDLVLNFEAWRPSVHGRMELDEAFDVDFLDPDAPEAGRFSLGDEGGLDDPGYGFRLSGRFPTPEGGYYVLFEGARWRGDTSLTSDKYMGAGMTLPAGTVVESNFRYFGCEVGFLARHWERPWFGGWGAGVALYGVGLEAEAGGGTLKAGTGALGPVLRLSVGMSPVDAFRIEATTAFLAPFIAGTMRWEVGVQTVLDVTSFRFSVGYTNLTGLESGTSDDEFSMRGFSFGLALIF